MRIALGTSIDPTWTDVIVYSTADTGSYWKSLHLSNISINPTVVEPPSSLTYSAVKPNNQYKIQINDNTSGRLIVEFVLSQITNQVTWTNDLAGLIQAHSDIASWIGTAVGASVQIVNTSGNPVPISSTALNNIDGKIPATLTTTPSQDVSAPPSRLVGEEIVTAGFSAVGSSVLDAFFNTPIVGTGVTYSQASGALNIASGTTANAEFLARSSRFFNGSMLMKFSIQASQRVANNNFAIMLADLVGENLTYNIVSATQLDVTITAHGWTSQMVGQFMQIGGFTGAAAVPGRYAIASIVDANTVRFTVSGFPASGTGTCTVFGRNYIRNLFTGTTATTMNWDVQRNGWSAGDTAATINTSANPGTIIYNDLRGREIFLQDKLRATSTTPTATTRASRDENIPDATVNLYVFIWNYNGTSAVQNTTYAIGHLSVETFANQPVYIQGFRTQGAINTLPVNITAGTLPTVTTVTTLSNGQTAHSTASTGSPLRIGGRVVPTTIATQDATLVAGDASDVGITSGQQVIVKENATAELDFNVAVSSIGTTITVQGLIQASGTASVRNFIKSIRVANDALGAAGNLWILDSALTVSSIAITTGLVTTSAAHDLRIGDVVVFTSLAGGTGVTANQLYYVTTVGTTTTFNFAAAPGGSNVVPSVAYTGTTMYRVFDQIRLQTAAGDRSFIYKQPLRGIPNTITNFLIPVSLTSGSVYITVNGFRGF